MNLPNSITLLRIVLVPVFAWLHLSGRPAGALAVFAFAAISDGVDGLLARALNQRTELGAILDPIADKFLALTALVLLVSVETLPAWLLAVALLRDGIVFGTGLTSKLTRRPIAAEPTRISKYATFTLMTAITLGLLVRADPRGRELIPYVAAAGIVAAECMAVAAFQYTMRWRHLLDGRAAGAMGRRERRRTQRG
ncbi:MAG TPA: CDP-alcohol phosphatidyltransferase family protein [Vulgatibacter sp.]|nr:CDP-alcohol phosphatidyltransferase family protein [Vulgatibacter sp.]